MSFHNFPYTTSTKLRLPLVIIDSKETHSFLDYACSKLSKSQIKKGKKKKKKKKDAGSK